MSGHSDLNTLRMTNFCWKANPRIHWILTEVLWQRTLAHVFHQLTCTTWTVTLQTIFRLAAPMLQFRSKFNMVDRFAAQVVFQVFELALRTAVIPIPSICLCDNGATHHVEFETSAVAWNSGPAWISMSEFGLIYSSRVGNSRCQVVLCFEDCLYYRPCSGQIIPELVLSSFDQW